MILSDEPGYYENGNFGIRIESLVKVVKMETKHKMPSKSVFLGFEPVTVTPIQKKMIVPELMTKQELEWLNNYHQLCRDRWWNNNAHVQYWYNFSIMKGEGDFGTTFV